MNPEMKFFLETNCVSPKRGADWKLEEEQKQENLMDAEPDLVQALDLGSGARRSRRFVHNLGNLQYDKMAPGDPDETHAQAHRWHRGARGAVRPPRRRGGRARPAVRSG